MLILSRRKGQSILIGDDIEVIVTEVHRSSVKIAVRAPKHLTVMRSEIAADHASDVVASDAFEDPVD
jgi:carbon storage regulator